MNSNSLKMKLQTKQHTIRFLLKKKTVDRIFYILDFAFIHFFSHRQINIPKEPQTKIVI